ncbi:MAG: hypothetical protein E7341_03535 [Clostridiales bacterium]|nr:hypothetical protein [Clostridiales bacterium]
MNRIYCAIGKIVEVTQFIEVRLGDICEKSEIIKEFSRHAKMTKEAYEQIQSDAGYIKDKMLTMTFGAMIGVIYESKSLSYDETTELKTLLEKRNYFTHEYFKYTTFENAKEQDIVEEFEALKEYLARLKKFLNRLEIIYAGQKERLEYLIAKNNL